MLLHMFQVLKLKTGFKYTFWTFMTFTPQCLRMFQFNVHINFPFLWRLENAQSAFMKKPFMLDFLVLLQSALACVDWVTNITSKCFPFMNWTYMELQTWFAHYWFGAYITLVFFWKFYDALMLALHMCSPALLRLECVCAHITGEFLYFVFTFIMAF